MARGSTRRSYVRDGRGRFASTGTTTAKAKPAARRAQRGTNRLTRDNGGKITGVGKNGATTRGGRLRTAAGNLRGAVLDRHKRAPLAGTVGRGGKVRGGARVAKPAAPAMPAKAPRAGKAKGPSKGERVLARIAQNFARASAESRSKKEERKLARTFAVAEMAQSRVSRLAVGKRDPAQQYTRAELLPQLNKSLKRPIPKRERKSTLNPDFIRGLRGIAQGGIMKLRAAARKQGKLTGSRAPKQLRSGRTAGTVSRPKGYAPPKVEQARPKLQQASRRSLRISASGPAGKYKGAWNMPQFTKGPRSAGTVRRPKGYSPPNAARSTRTVYRTRAQATRAQQARTNTLGRATAAKRGFNEAIGKRSGFADSAPRTVIGRPRIAQLSLSGRVERVGAGRFRTVGERTGGGSIRRPRSKPGPMRGTKAWKRQLEQAIKANGGKDVAAFRF